MIDTWQRQADSLRRAEAWRSCEPPEAEYIALTPNGDEIYAGDEVVCIDGEMYLLENLTVSDLLEILNIKPEIAREE